MSPATVWPLRVSEPHPAPDPPVDILAVLDRLFAAIGAGEKGWRTPPDGYVEVRWLSKKGCYRVTLDLLPPDFPPAPP